MYWIDIEEGLKAGRKVRRSKWKPAIHLVYRPDEKRTYIYSPKKHKYKPWYSSKNDLTDASDWTFTDS